MLRTSWFRSLAAAALLSAFLIPQAPHARADEVYTFVVKKQEEKKKTRWSLQEWLDTRDRIRLMDLWLALHSPSPYEFFIAADYRPGSVPGNASYTGWQFAFSGFASIFGLEFNREVFPDVRWHGLFRLRVFGYHDQSTNITLETGVRQQNGGADSAFRNPLAGVAMTIYLGRFFGINGLYRHYFTATPNAGGLDLSGNRYEGGAFLDFSFLRLYGSYFTEYEDSTKGVALGTKIYF